MWPRPQDTVGVSPAGGCPVDVPARGTEPSLRAHRAGVSTSLLIEGIGRSNVTVTVPSAATSTV